MTVAAHTPLNPELHRLLEFCNMDRTWMRGEGAWLYDDKGHAFLDCYSQYGAVVLGHNPDCVVKAIRGNLDAMAPAMVQPFRAPNAVRLAQALTQAAPGNLSRCVFTTSGAETVEAALKLAMLRDNRPLMLSCIGAYHGKTSGAMSLSGEGAYGELFGPPNPQFIKVPFDDILALETCLTEYGEKIAAFFLEPIQGECGIRIPTDGYLTTVRELCTRYDIALVLDEIQTGLGRTGPLFCYEYEGVEPDMLLISKALGGGVFPLGACLVNETFWSPQFALSHSSTFANNNISCGVGLTVLESLTAMTFCDEVKRKGERLLSGLSALSRKYPSVIRGVRGKGLLCAIDLESDLCAQGLFLSYMDYQGLFAYGFASALAHQESVLILPALGNKNVLRIIPPLVITELEIDRMIGALNRVCAAMTANATQTLVATVCAMDQPAIDAGHRQRPVVLPPIKYASKQYLSMQDDVDSQFAFLMHYTQPIDVAITDPSLALLTDKELERYCSYIADAPPGVVFETKTMQSLSGACVKGWLVALGKLPEEMYRRGKKHMMNEVLNAVALSTQLGAEVVGLGAFTSIFGSRNLALRECGAAVTTGNSLTAAMSFFAIRHIADTLNMSFSDATVCVVGARGAVGSLCAQLLARQQPGAMILVGNAHGGASHLEHIQTLLRAHTDCPISITTDLSKAADCDIVLSATSSRLPVLDEVFLRPGAIVCDVARPQDAGDKTRERTDLFVTDGGLVALPDPTMQFGVGNIQGLADGVQLACLSETMLLALEHETRHFGIGETETLAQVDYVIQLAEKHGFSLSTPEREIGPRLLQPYSQSYGVENIPRSSYGEVR